MCVYARSFAPEDPQVPIHLRVVRGVFNIVKVNSYTERTLLIRTKR